MKLSDLQFDLDDSSYTPRVIVIGMGRSGTSLTAKILASLGVHIGDVLDVHNEAVSFKETNKALLRSEGSNSTRPRPFVDKLGSEAFVAQKANQAVQLLGEWSADYGTVKDHQLWGWKDPRNSLTLPVWLELFPQAKVIHMIRNGIDVALSLYRRQRRRYFFRTREPRLFPPTIARGYRLWSQYLDIIFEHEDRFETTDWTTVYYEQMISQPRAQIESLCRFLNLRPDQESIHEIAHSIVGHPTQPSRVDKIQVRILLKLGAIDIEPLVSLPGYAHIQTYLQE